MEMTVLYSGGLHAAWLLNVCVCAYVHPYAHVSVCVCAFTQRETAMKAHLREYQRVSAAMLEMVCVQVGGLYLFIYLLICDEPSLALDSLHIWQECTEAGLSLQIKAADPLWLSEKERVRLSVCLFGQLCSSPPRSDSLSLTLWTNLPPAAAQESCETNRLQMK